MPWRKSLGAETPELPELPARPAGRRRFGPWRWLLILLLVPFGLFVVFRVIPLFLFIGMLAADVEKPLKPLPGMSEDFADFTVGYGGDVYTLPAPMSEFLANGWEVRRMTDEELEQKVRFYSRYWTDEQVEAYRARELERPDSPDELLEAGGELYLRILRGNEEDIIAVWNPSGTSLPLRDCFVAQLSANPNGPRLLITGGITYSTSEGYVEDALEGTGYTHSATNDYSWYTLQYSEQSYYKISCLSMFGSKVEVIQVCNKVPPGGQ